VWQEFPLSSSGISNVPPDDPAYLDRMEAYARDVVAARRNHPSLALWGGGNELTQRDGRPLTLDHPYAQRLQHVIHTHDPARDFRPSSPLGPTFDADPAHPVQWDVHGPWEYSQRQPGPQYWRINDITPALHSELGAPGMASLRAQRRYLSPKYRSCNPANPAWRHHGGAWWDHSTTLEQLFGPIEDDEMAVLASQWLQAEALRYYVEEARRRWPRSGGIYPWQLNEPWPNVACTSAVEYGGRPKLAYHAVRQAYRPTAATAHYPGLTIPPGEPLHAEIWALNDGDSADADLLVSLRDLQGRELAPDIGMVVSLPANASMKLLDLHVPLPGEYSGIVLLELTLAGVSSRYIFSNAPQPWLRPALNHPEILSGMFD
jgi:beta-mannosidase